LGKRVSIVPCAPKSKRKRFEFGGLIWVLYLEVVGT
jgi:ribosomal protein S17